MNDYRSIKYFYFLGIGGIGMSALARYFKEQGKVVCGYDKTKTHLTMELSSGGIEVHYEDSVTNIPGFLSGSDVNSEAMVIYTPAIPKDNEEFNHLKSVGYRMWKRSEVLGWLTSESKTIAVAGTHGKTTTSTMIAHILKHSGINCTAFLGGISKNYHTNLLLPVNHVDEEVVVVEADEYDRSFLTLHPNIAVITSLDADHLDIYGTHSVMIESYNAFANQVKSGGILLIKSGLGIHTNSVAMLSYSISQPADYKAENIRVTDGKYVFDVNQQGTLISDVVLNWPGRHNVENAVAAIATCLKFGLPVEKIMAGIGSFQGVVRRFDYQIQTDELVLIDDYAHHPEELRAAIRSVKELYPDRKLLGIFQPHLYSRTRDFAADFAKSLSELDELILLDIYPAREKPIPGITSEIILDKVTLKAKQICSKEQLAGEVTKSDAGVVLTLGAGDIDQLVEPVKNTLLSKLNRT